MSANPATRTACPASMRPVNWYGFIVNAADAGRVIPCGVCGRKLKTRAPANVNAGSAVYPRHNGRTP